MLGQYPGDPGEPGGDCSGTSDQAVSHPTHGAVTAGESIFGLAPGCLGNSVSIPVTAWCMVYKPHSISHAQAASMPTVLITVCSALETSSWCRAPRVLIHAAAGGIGQAAVQLMAALNVETVGTCGSPFKRHLVRTSGTSSAVGASRSLAFVEAGVLSGMHQGVG